MVRILQFVLRYPRAVVVVSLAFVLALGAGVVRLEIDPSIKNMLPESMPEWQNLEKFEEMFAASEMVLVAVRSDDLLAAERLQRLAAFQETLEEMEDAYRVVSIFSTKYLESSANSFTPVDLVDPDDLPDTPAERETLRQRLLGDDQYVGSLVSNDLSTVAFVVLPEEDFDDERLARDAMAAAEEAFGDDAMVTGLPATRAAVMDGMQGDLKTFMPIGIILMILLLVFSFRTWLGAILPLLVVILSIAATFGLMGYVGEKIRMVTLIMPVMLIAVANDYGIHLVAHYLGRLGENVDSDRRVVVFRVTRSLGIPVVAAGMTTVAGFLTLTTHVIPSARMAGLLSAFGVVTAFVLSLTFVPAMLVLLRPPRHVATQFSTSRLTRLLVAISRFLRVHGRKAVAGLMVLGVVAALGLPDVQVDTDPVRYFHEGSAIRQTNEYVNRVFGGSVQMNVVVKGDLKSPDLLRKMDRFQEHLETLPMVSRTQSLADIVKRMNRAFHGDDPDAEVIPDSRNLIAQYLLLYSFNSDLSDFDHFVDFEYTNAQIAARVSSTSSSDLQALVQDTEHYIDANLSRDEFPYVSGFVTVLGELVDLVVKGQLISLVVSLFLVFLVGSLLFRSLIGGLYVVLPLVFAVLVVFGLMGHFDIELNIATAMLASIVIGVGVDYIIHFLWHYRTYLRQTGDGWQAVEATLMESGRGIIVNAFSVVIGFSVMLLSNFLPIFFFGFLLTISILSCLVAALVILPVAVTLLKPSFVWGETLVEEKPSEAPEAMSLAPGKNRQVRVATGILAAAVAVGAAWLLWVGGDALVRWGASLPPETGFWSALWGVIVHNPSIAAAIYALICLNSAGVAEFRFRRPFVLAFLLAVPLTPLLMIGAWARRRPS